MKTIVAYYSRFGHTRVVAETLARELGAELRRFEETRPRGFPGMGWAAITNARWKLKPVDLDFSGYDLIVLATPIWAGRPAAPTRTFLRDARLENKKLAVIFSNSGNGYEQALEIVRKDLAGRPVEIVGHSGAVTQATTDEALQAAARDFARTLRQP